MCGNRIFNFAFLSLILIGFSISSCKTKKALTTHGFKNDFVGISGLECSETQNPDAIDSRVGSIDCSDISFTYDYGKFSNPGPMTPEEEFRRSFDTYHHMKFFEYRMIDPKVYKIFLDSVDVVNVRRKKAEDNHFIDCEPCNTTAEITFKGDTYYYPITLSENQLNREGYTCRFEEKGDLIYKYFQIDGESPGLYISPKKNRYKKKNSLSLMVSKTTLPKNKVDQILKSIYLIK